MLTEEQVLTKLASYKDAIIKIKKERDKAKAVAQSCRNNQK